MHVIGRITCALTLTLVLPAQAQQDQQQQQPTQQQQQQQQVGPERLEVDTNLICDTQQQVERFVTLLDDNGGSAEAAIATVNAENKTPDACIIATIAYRRTGIAGEVKNATATFDVLRIVVTGVYTVNGLELAVPTELFTLMPRDVKDGTVGQGSSNQGPSNQGLGSQDSGNQSQGNQGADGQGPGRPDGSPHRP